MPAPVGMSGGSLGPGIAAAWLGLIVLIPVAAVIWKSLSDGLARLHP